MSDETKNYPFKIKKIETKEHEEVLKYFNGDGGILDEFVRIGPKDYWFPQPIVHVASKIYNMEVRPDDVWVITFPKAGTTWTQELVWQVANDFDYAKAEAVPLVDRFPFIEFSCVFDSDKARNKLIHDDVSKTIVDSFINIFNRIVEMESPRFIKSHLPLSLLPPSLLDTCKVIHVARDPRDVAVSYYHHCYFFKIFGYTGNFKQFWNLFIENKITWTPFFENVKESWEKRNHANMLFLIYEDLLKDLPSTVKRVAKFLGKPVTEEQVMRLCDHLAFDNIKKNKSVNMDSLTELDIGLTDSRKSFIRKGKAGGWREYFDEEMTRQADQWIADNLRDTDLRFPTIN